MRILISTLLIVASCLAYLIGLRMSPGAIEMAVGLLFGAMMTMPLAIMIVVSRLQAVEDERRHPQRPTITNHNYHYHYHAAATESRDQFVVAQPNQIEVR